MLHWSNIARPARRRSRDRFPRTELEIASGLAREDEPIGSTPTGRIFSSEHGGVNPRVDRLNLETGERHHLREIRPVNSTGVVSTTAPVMTPDGKRYAFTLIRRLTDLFLVEGLDA